MVGSSQGSDAESGAPLEVAEILRRYGPAFRARYGHTLSVAQERAVRELEVCRTAELGGHLWQCDACGLEKPVYNSCRNRNCPTCQGHVRAAWYQDQARRMLPVEYFHVVMTLPEELARLSQLAEANRRLLYGMLCQATGAAILEVGRQWSGLRARMGVVLVLHSWGQLMNVHPHCHCLVPGGGLTADGERWVSLPRSTFLPKAWLAEVFRDTYLGMLREAYCKGELVLSGAQSRLHDPDVFERWVGHLAARRWIIHAESAHAGQEVSDAEGTERIVKYLARYAAGVAMHNSRLESIDRGQVTFTYKDYRHGGRRKTATLDAVEFLGRFLSHVLPRGMRHIRHYGFLTLTQCNKNIEKIRALLGTQQRDDSPGQPPESGCREEPWIDDGSGGPKCPVCQRGRMQRWHGAPRPTIAELLAAPWPAPKHQQLLAALEAS